MPVQIFDDGTRMVTDDAGNVISYTDTNGYVYGPDSSIARDFLMAIAGGVSAAVRDAFRPSSPQPTPAPAVPGSLQATLAGLAPVVAIGGLGYLAYRALK